MCCKNCSFLHILNQVQQEKIWEYKSFKESHLIQVLSWLNFWILQLRMVFSLP